MSGIPSLTILSEDQKFNGDNLLQWKTNIIQLLGAKGLIGYLDGKIKKPTSEPETTPTTTTTPTVTPIYSTTPTLDEWMFRDQLARGHITLNCVDVAALGVKTTGTAKDAWDSIQEEWGKSTDMRRSHAQEALNRTEFAEGMDIQDHIKLLRTRKVAVDNLCTEAMTDETWRGIIIRSIPPTTNWLPVIPSLYTMTTSADIVSTLVAHGMILGRGASKVSTGASSSSTALATRTTNGCTNPNCKAKKPSSHTIEDCYWPGGGKEGQFPPNFGTTPKASIANTTSSEQPEHFVLSARNLSTPGQSGVLIDDHHVKRDIPDIPVQGHHCECSSKIKAHRTQCITEIDNMKTSDITHIYQSLRHQLRPTNASKVPLFDILLDSPLADNDHDPESINITDINDDSDSEQPHQHDIPATSIPNEPYQSDRAPKPSQTALPYQSDSEFAEYQQQFGEVFIKQDLENSDLRLVLAKRPTHTVSDTSSAVYDNDIFDRDGGTKKLKGKDEAGEVWDVTKDVGETTRMRALQLEDLNLDLETGRSGTTLADVTGT